MASIGDVWLRLGLEGTQLEVDAKRQGKKAGEAAGGQMSIGIRAKLSDLFKGGAIFGLGANLANAGIAQLGNAVVGLGDLLASANKAASDLNESASKSRVIFGQSATGIEAFGATAARSLGISKQAAIEASATFGNIFVGLDIAQPKAAEMSQRLVTLAGDLASFNNLDPTVALEKLRSGLAGEAEPLRAVGVFLTEAKVKAEAMKLGLADSHGELSEGAKILARYQLILEQTGTAQGDFARTSEGLANSQRIANAELDNARADLGAASMPLALLTTQLQTDFVRGLGVAGGAMGEFGGAIAGIGDALLPWDTATEKAAKDAAALAAAATEAAKTSVFQVERAAQNMADNAGSTGKAFKGLSAEATAMAVAIGAAGVSAAQSVENMRDRIVKAAMGVIDGAYGAITNADQLSATNAEIAATRRTIAMGSTASGTNRATDAIDRQIASTQKAMDVEKRRDDASETIFQRTMHRLAGEYQAQLDALDVAEKQIAIADRRRGLNEQLNAAQADLGKVQGGTNAQAISDAMAKVADIQAQQAENERQLMVASQRERLEATKAYIDNVAKIEAEAENKRALANTLRKRDDKLTSQLAVAQAAKDAPAIADITAKLEAVKTAEERTAAALRAGDKQSELGKLKAQLAEQRAAINTSGSATVADAKARLHELYKTQADEVLALALAGHMGSKEVADALVDMKTRLTTATGDEQTAILATIKALKDLQDQAERTFVTLPGGGSVPRPVGAPGGPQVKDSGGWAGTGLWMNAGPPEYVLDNSLSKRLDSFLSGGGAVMPGERSTIIPSMAASMGDWTAGRPIEITVISQLDAREVSRSTGRILADELRR